MIASSTSAPTAMAIPPSVIVLMLAPMNWSDRTVQSNDRGIASAVTMVARPLARKTSTMSTTRIAPSRSAADTLSHRPANEARLPKPFSL